MIVSTDSAGSDAPPTKGSWRCGVGTRVILQLDGPVCYMNDPTVLLTRTDFDAWVQRIRDLDAEVQQLKEALATADAEVQRIRETQALAGDLGQTSGPVVGRGAHEHFDH